MVIFLAALAMHAHSTEDAKVQLIEDFDQTWKEGAWQFSNGPEFPGAKGSFERSTETAHSGANSGKLSFDFSGGGNYVAAMRKLSGAPLIQCLRLWVKNASGNRLTFRYTDQTGQTLQKTVVTPPYGEWAEVEIECFNFGGHWGGANDGAVHGPPTMIALLMENDSKKQGALFVDDIQFVLGKPVVPVWTYPAMKFTPDEGWHCWGDGQGAKTSLTDKKWKYDFNKGEGIVLGPRDVSLPGTPKQIHIRFRGDASGHSARLRFATHFMTFEKNIGPPKPVAGEDGVQEFVTAAPPSEGWTWHGGENDGKLHGPLRINGITLECNGKRDAGELELLDIRVEAECSSRRLLTMVADLREKEEKREFVATIRSLSDKPTDAEMKWTIRNWAGKTVAESSRKITIPPAAESFEVAVPPPAGDQKFLEAEFSLLAPGQDVAPIQAYYMAPVVPAESVAQLEPASPFGMGLYLYRYGSDPRGLAEMERAAKMGAAAGVKWSREEFSFQRIEPAKGKFDWKFYDSVVATAKRNGITIYGEFSYWTNWTKPYTPEGIEDYCQFVAASVERYREDIQHWEIWNEPNIFFWQGPREMYAELLKQAYAAVKKANRNAQVLGCSTAGIDHNFIKLTMKLGAPFDILTIHPYRGHLDDRSFIGDLLKVAELVKKPDGSPRQVWITEMGWATHTPHNSMAMDFKVTTQRRQAELIARAYVDSIASNVAPNISWYDFRCDGDDPFNFEHCMGIITRDFRPKPAYCAYATMTRMLKGLKVEKTLNLGADVIAYRFGSAVALASLPAGRSVICLWSAAGNRTVSLPATKPMVVTGLMGDTEKLAPAGGNVSVALRSEVPVFVTEE
jgi:hypothetical protein